MPKYQVYISCRMVSSTDFTVEAEDYDKASEIALERAERRPRDYGWDYDSDTAEDFEVMDVDEVEEPATKVATTEGVKSDE